MKNSLTSLVTSLSVSTLLTSCNPQNAQNLLDSLNSSAPVNTTFTLTGSGQDTVAQTKIHPLFTAIIPSAYALTPPQLFDVNGQAVSLVDAWMVIKKIQFDSQEISTNTRNEGEVKLSGPFVVDLLSDNPESFGDVILPSKGIRKVKMELHRAEQLPLEAPAELLGKSIFLRGRVNGIPFKYSSSDSTEFKIRGPHAIMPDSSSDMLAVIRIADLFKKIDLSSILTPTEISAKSRIVVSNPCPLIDPSANDLYTCFRKGLESEAKFGKDNGDMDLDDLDECVSDEEGEDSDDYYDEDPDQNSEEDSDEDFYFPDFFDV